MTNASKFKGPVKEQTFVRRNRQAMAIQFTGINGSDIVDFALERRAKAKNGGKWVIVRFQNKGEDVREVVMRPGDLLVWNIPGLNVLTNEQFHVEYVVEDHHELIEPKYNPYKLV